MARVFPHSLLLEDGRVQMRGLIPSGREPSLFLGLMRASLFRSGYDGPHSHHPILASSSQIAPIFAELHCPDGLLVGTLGVCGRSWSIGWQLGFVLGVGIQQLLGEKHSIKLGLASPITRPDLDVSWRLWMSRVVFQIVKGPRKWLCIHPLQSAVSQLGLGITETSALNRLFLLSTNDTAQE